MDFNDTQSTYHMIISALKSQNIKILEFVLGTEPNAHDLLKQLVHSSNELLMQYACRINHRSNLDFLQYMYDLFLNQNDTENLSVLVLSILLHNSHITILDCRDVLCPMILDANIKWCDLLRLLFKCPLDIFEEIVNRDNLSIKFSDFTYLIQLQHNPQISYYCYLTFDECRPRTNDDKIALLKNYLSIYSRWTHSPKHDDNRDTITNKVIDDIFDDIDPTSKFSQYCKKIINPGHYCLPESIRNNIQQRLFEKN